VTLQLARQHAMAAWGSQCVAGALGVPGCANLDGGLPRWWELEADHVRPSVPWGQLAKPVGVGGFGKRPAHEGNLMPLCYHHHQGGWATSHRELQRELLTARRNGASLEACLALGRARLHEQEEL
jgi:hypothetical protein